ncbi:MAG: amino acid permease [Planctomycetaceae bacterium]|nr:amino acid permease [Planctomycetaceae bacterium]
MNEPTLPESDDVRTLHKLGYAQELSRVLGGFSNFAISLSIICILAGGITSFHVGYCSVGGAAIGLGWPLVCLFSLCVAATMGQIASAFPTAGGLYHWAAILGGRGWGWTTAWFNLAGLVTVLAGINVGTYLFAVSAFFPDSAPGPLTQFVAVLGLTASQAIINHRGIRVTQLLTDFSGYWILVISAVLMVSLFTTAPTLDIARLWTFSNYSGLESEPDKLVMWPRTESLLWLFALGFLLPAYTITGFDASAHVSEETSSAARNVPRGIVRSVLVSGIFGWLMLCAIVLAMRDPAAVAAKGDGSFVFTLRDVLPGWFASILLACIVIAQYLCGLATVTSASRMMFAFARDGGLPASKWVRSVSPRYRTPVVAIWVVAVTSVMFTIYADVYSTITAVCVIFLYLSYVLPTAIGLVAHGRWWTEMGPWQLGRWFRPLAVVSILGCGGLIVIGMQPPNEKAATVVCGAMIVLGVLWFAIAKYTFPGPPHGVLTTQQQQAIHAAELAVHETEDSKAAP